MKYFCFCQGELLLTSVHAIPEDLTTLPQPSWQCVTSLRIGDTSCQVVRLESPVCEEGFVMVPLRKSYELLSAEDYALAGKAA